MRCGEGPLPSKASPSPNKMDKFSFTSRQERASAPSKPTPHFAALALSDIDEMPKLRAARKIATRFGVQPHIARLLCQLAGLGGAAR
jgi:hypothetical protein